MKKAMFAMALLTAVVLFGCGGDDPEYETVTKDVTVSFAPFVVGATLDLTPTYTPAIAGDGFVDGDVVYTLTDDKGNTWNKTTGYSVVYSLYTLPDTITFTQTFKMGNEVISSQIVKSEVVPSGGGRFGSILNATGENIGAIPSIDLHLSKQVEK